MIPGDLSWPVNADFWKCFGGQLTPTGADQHKQLGSRLAMRYPSLMEGVPDYDITEHVRCVTSQVQRTLFSAWSLLSGVFPHVPRHFSYADDRIGVDLDNAEEMLNLTDGIKTLGIAINVESAGNKEDKIFHQLKTECKTDQMFKKTECLKAPELAIMADDPVVCALADRLFKITQWQDLDPHKPIIERIAAFLRIGVQIEIAETHGFPALPNKYAEVLTAEEKHLIEKAAKIVMKHHYRPVGSDMVSEGIGRAGAGYLASSIGALIRSNKMKTSKLRFVEYSAHDSTILALASLLGLDIDWVGFTGHFIFEVYPSGELQVIYNNDPPAMTDEQFLSAQGRTLPLNGKYVAFNDLPVGATSTADFVKYVRSRDIFKAGQLLRSTTSDHSSLDDTKTKEWTEKEKITLKNSFDFYDIDNSGQLSASELLSACRRAGEHHTTIEHVQHLLEAIGKSTCDSIGFEDFLRLLGMLSIAMEQAEANLEEL